MTSHPVGPPGSLVIAAWTPGEDIHLASHFEVRHRMVGMPGERDLVLHYSLRKEPDRDSISFQSTEPGPSAQAGLSLETPHVRSLPDCNDGATDCL